MTDQEKTPEKLALAEVRFHELCRQVGCEELYHQLRTAEQDEKAAEQRWQAALTNAKKAQGAAEKLEIDVSGSVASWRQSIDRVDDVIQMDAALALGELSAAQRYLAETRSHRNNIHERIMVQAAGYQSNSFQVYASALAAFEVPQTSE